MISASTSPTERTSHLDIFRSNGTTVAAMFVAFDVDLIRT
ncbi:hypothetical protein AVEN_150571-1, partial [Araneus ventricosus]